MKKIPFLCPDSDQERGQILLVIILFMVIVLTVGLSLATRSLTNLRQAAEEDDTQRAFSAAEAGVQVALERNIDSQATNFTSSAGYNAVIKRVGGTAINLNHGRLVPANESTDVWLSQYVPGTNPTFSNQWSGALTIHWGTKSNACQDAAVAISVVYGVTTNPTIRQFAVDPCNGTRRTSNGFSAPTSSVRSIVAGKPYDYHYTISPSITNGFVARVIPLYSDTLIAAGAAGAPLPPQGRVIESTGSSGSTERKIVVEEGNPKFPIEMFPYVLFTAVSQ